MIPWLLTTLLCCSGPDTPAPSPVQATAHTGVTQPTPTGDTSSGALTQLQTAQAALAADGFLIQEGALAISELEDCCSWPDCQQRTSTEDRAVWLVPLAPGEPPAQRVLNEEGLQFSYRLRENEALVYIGPPAPQAAYLGMRTYLHERLDEATYQRVPGPIGLGDPLSQLQGSDPLILITSADQQIVARVTEALTQSGYPAASIQVDVVPPGLTLLGTGYEADSFRTELHVAQFSDEGARQAWLSQPPGELFRASLPESVETSPYPAPTYRVPGSGTTEASHAEALAALHQAILDTYADHAIVEASVTPSLLPEAAPCEGDCNRDLASSSTQPFALPLAEQTFLLIYGVNHARTGKASLQSAVVFGELNHDPAAASQNTEWVGSARELLPDHPLVDDLYVWRFARDCQGLTHCTVVPVDCPGVQDAESATVRWQSYLEPTTLTRPLHSELLTEGALLLQPPS